MKDTAVITTPVKMNEVTARDSHQSLLATRMRNEDVLEIVRENTKAGFNALEVWGGATFDVAMRYLGENPWQNLRNIKAAVKESAAEAGVSETPLMMLLRSQSLVGYKNYPDDVVKAFVRSSAENGMNIFRVFDGLNDMRNLKAAVDEIKACQDDDIDVQAQGTICYTTGPTDESAPEDATPLQKQTIFNLDYYVGKAKELKEMGCDTICLKDMAGLMEPDVVAELIPAIQEETGLEVTLHMHAGMGLSDATLMRAVKVGVDVIDVGNAGLASGSGHSSAQMILDMMERSEDPAVKQRIPDIAKKTLKTVREFLLKIRPKYASWEGPYNPQMQDKTWNAQIPGGMLSNFESQIKVQIKGMDVSFDEVLGSVLDEVPRVREDLGWPPLVTPCSQIVGVQAVLNVLSELRGGERYAQMPKETQNLLLGELGRTPVQPDTDLVKRAEQEAKRNRITCRPADKIADGIEKTKEQLAGRGLLADNIEDIVSVALYEQFALDFLEKGKTAQTEAKPTLPAHMTIKSVKDGVVALGDAHKAFGSHVLEAIAQTAKEINRIEDGFFQFLPQEEMEYRLHKYHAYIEKQLSEIPDRLHEAGFSEYQTQWALVSSPPLQSFNQIMRDRCIALGVRPDTIPQISELTLRQHFGQVRNLDPERAPTVAPEVVGS